MCCGSVPRPDTADPLGSDSRDVARRWVVHGRELHFWPEVHPRQTLEELGGASLGYAGPSMNHQVLGEAVGGLAARLHRQNDPRVPTHVGYLPPDPKMTSDDLAIFEADPHERHLWRSVRVKPD